MKLSAIKSGKLDRPKRIVLFGPEGVGKSTFAAQAPDPVFIGTEDGTSELDVARFPEPGSYEEIIEAIDELKAGEHGFKTLVIDTLDWLEPLVFAKAVADYNRGTKGRKISSIEDFGYGKGYVAALELWRELLAKLDDLRHAKGMHVILLAHAQVKTFRNPQGDDFDRYQMKLNDKGAGLIREWSDAVLFAQYETLVVKADGERKGKGVGDGARLLHTERRDAFDAKNRYSLPDTMPLDWPELWGAIQRGEPDDCGAIASRCRELSEGITDETIQAKVNASLEANKGNAQKLSQLENWLKGKVAQ